MANKSVPATIETLLEKGGGVLLKRGLVWTYPGALNDPSGTNLKIPLESVPDAAVQEALSQGALVTRVADITGAPTSVARAPADGELPVRMMNVAEAGSVEMGTELPLNSRPTHDAGRKPDSASPVVVTGSATEPKPVAASPLVAPVPAAAPPVPPAAK